MRIEGLVFAGIASANEPGLAAFIADVLGVESVREPRFLVEGVDTATMELRRRGVEPDGERLQNDEYRYQHFCAPDRRVFELHDRRV